MHHTSAGNAFRASLTRGSAAFVLMAPTGHAIIAAYACILSSAVTGCLTTADLIPLRAYIDGHIHRQTSQSMQLSSTYKLPATFCRRGFLYGNISMVKSHRVFRNIDNLVELHVQRTVSRCPNRINLMEYIA